MAYMTSILSLFEVPRLERRSNKRELSILGGGFKYVSFSSLLGEMAQFGQLDWNYQLDPTSIIQPYVAS